jgi:predicted ATP-grasp superfamily ATP-dependent carboligase
MNRKATGAIIIEGHVQGLSNTRSLGEAGIPVYVVDKNACIAAKSKYCKKFFICPDFQTDAFADFLIELAQKEGINGWVLIPSNDHAVYTISRNKSKLSRHYKVITPELAIVENIYDKRKLLEIAAACGTPVPNTQYFSVIDENIDTNLCFPVLTKGRNGLSFYKATGKKAFLAADEAELRLQLRQIKKVYPIEGTFTQELIPGGSKNKTISFTAFCIDGEIKSYWMGAKLREHPIQFGTATFAKSVYVEDCLNQSVPLLKSLDYTGVCEVEYLMDSRDGKYKLIEINARTWLWVGLAKACGINYALYMYNYVNSIETDYPLSYELNIKWRNPYSDFIFSGLAIIKGRMRLFDYFNQNKGKIVSSLWVNNDKKPFFYYGFMVFNFLKNR